MDPKAMIDMNNLKVLNDYLNQTIEVLSRQPRAGQPGSYGFSPASTFTPYAQFSQYSPFTPFHAGAPVGTDTVYGPWFGGAAPQAPIGGFPGFGAADPYYAQRAYGQGGFAPMMWSPWQQQQQGWGAAPEFARQAQLTQAMAARQSVLEAMCRACGIPV